MLFPHPVTGKVAHHKIFKIYNFLIPPLHTVSLFFALFTQGCDVSLGFCGDVLY